MTWEVPVLLLLGAGVGAAFMFAIMVLVDPLRPH